MSFMSQILGVCEMLGLRIFRLLHLPRSWGGNVVEGRKPTASADHQ